MKRFFLLICFFGTNFIVDAQTIFDSIMSNIRNVQWGNIQSAVSLDFSKSEISNTSSLNRDVNKIRQKQSSDGHWDDIDYTLHTQTGWLPTEHLVRLHKMVIAFTYPKNVLNGDIQLYQSIVNGLQYWYDKDPRSTNWWYQQIFCPKQIGEMLILMRATKSVPKILEDSLIQRMIKIGGEPNGRYSEGSANRINISSHWIYRGCLTDDLTILEEGIRNALIPIHFSAPGRGVQYDYSYQEHGRQLYIGNYGYAFVDNVSSMALFLNGTRYALSGSELDLFSHFVRDTYLKSIRGKYYSFSIPGRQVANKGDLDRSKTVEMLKKMEVVDPIYQNEYKAAAGRWSDTKPSSFQIKPSHTQYYFSDYTNHVSPNYTFDVRYVSTRTVRTENINSQDKKGFFLSDGATNMTINGDEYFNIFPVWDWCRVPGVTAPHYDSLPDMKVSVGGSAGVTDFNGGVSDSLFGATCYSMDYKQFQTSAKKSWFFFENQIVCLGADIESENPQPIFTSVTQCRSIGLVYIGNNKVSGLFAPKKIYKDDKSLVHNGFGYYFPDMQNVIVANQMQTGNWHDISVSEEDKKVSQPVFSIWFDHGVHPKDANYAYYIFPNINNADQLNKLTKETDVSILQNDKIAQVVYSYKMKLFEAIFYKKSEFKVLNYKLNISNPCAIMIKEAEGKYKLHVADPSQKLLSIAIELTDLKNDKKHSFNIALPQNEKAGSSVLVNF